MNFIMLRWGERALWDKCLEEVQFECRSPVLWEYHGKSELILENSMVALDKSWLSVISCVVLGK